MDQTKVIEISRNYIFLLKQKNFSVQKAYLYGSYAKGKNNENSDIDIAVFLQSLLDPIQTQIEMLILTWNFDTRIEPHPFHEEELTLKNPIIREILMTGIELNIH